MADICRRMEVSAQYGQIYKQRLIDSGYVQQVAHGYVDFSLPYLRDYVRSLLEDRVRPDETEAVGWEDFPPPSR